MESVNVKQFFLSLSPEHRQRWKKAYEDNLEYEKLGKHLKMPWMIPAWEHGLKLLNEVIQESNS